MFLSKIEDSHGVNINMRKIFFLTISILIAAITFSCNNSSGSSVTTGYTDPVFTTVKTQALKSYTVGSYRCPAVGSTADTDYKACGAIIYTGTLSDAAYVGFATGKDSTNPDFNLKIYWNASSIQTSGTINIDSSSYTVQINDGAHIYTAKTNPLNITISAGTDSKSIAIYTITFKSNIAVSDGSNTFTINSGDSIVAYKWPE